MPLGSYMTIQNAVFITWSSLTLTGRELKPASPTCTISFWYWLNSNSSSKNSRCCLSLYQEIFQFKVFLFILKMINSFCFVWCFMLFSFLEFGLLCFPFNFSWFLAPACFFTLFCLSLFLSLHVSLPFSNVFLFLENSTAFKNVYNCTDENVMSSFLCSYYVGYSPWLQLELGHHVSSSYGASLARMWLDYGNKGDKWQKATVHVGQVESEFYVSISTSWSKSSLVVYISKYWNIY